MRGRELWLAAVLLCALPQVSAVAAEKAAANTPPPPAVLVSPAERRPIGQQMEFVGRVEAFKRVDIRARVSGFLREQKFSAGAEVKEGDVLYLIEPEPFEAALAQRQAQVVAAIATQENAAVSLKRYQQLESRQVASEATLDLKVADEKRASASIKEAQAAQQAAEIQLSYTKIIAPISGRVGRSAIDPGNLVGPESGVLVTLVRTDKMYVLFSVTQAQLLAERKTGGSPEKLTIRAKLADGSLLKEAGQIDFVDVKVDARTDGQLVRAVFPNSEGILTDGQTIRIVIEQKNPAMQLTIPMAAISTDQAGPYVFIVDENGTAHQRRLKLGASRDGMVAISEGIKEGDRVVTNGLQKVRDGAKVAATLDNSSLSSSDKANQSQGGKK